LLKDSSELANYSRHIGYKMLILAKKPTMVPCHYLTSISNRNSVRPPKLSLASLLRLARQIDEDSDQSLRSLQARDRAIATGSGSLPHWQKLLLWIDKTEPTNQSTTEHAIESAMNFWLCLLGVLLGLISVSGLMVINGQQPINVLLFLALFIGSQWLILLLTLIVAAATGAGWQLPASLINPARLLLHKLSSQFNQGPHHDYFTELWRWALLRWGQLFGVAFNIGGLVAFVLILSFTDRSFGWGSTLSISDQWMHNLSSTLSWPWHNWLPAAVMDQATVLATRFSPLQVQFTAEQLEAMRLWWPFLFCVIILYGLVPRLLLWPLFHIIYRRKLMETFISYPGARLILDRMDSPIIETRAMASDAPTSDDNKEQLNQVIPSRDDIPIVAWTGALENDANQFLLEDLGLAGNQQLSAGLDLEQDNTCLSTLNEMSPDSIIVAVKSWEPPLAELNDFILAMPRHCDIYILLLPLPGKSIKDSEQKDWRLFSRSNNVRQLTVLLGQEIESPESGVDQC